MAPKSLKKISKKSSKDYAITVYKRKVEEKMNSVNTITLIPIRSNACASGPVRKILEKATFFLS